MISILLATYNGEEYIKESIDSIINQTFTEWELLIGFNGTIDGSKKIVESYMDDRIRIFDYGDDKGKSKTLNKLLQESKFNWCAIQDDDDIWDINKLEKQVKYFNDFDIIGTFIEYINKDGLIIGSPKLFSDHDSIVSLSLNGNNQIANTTTLFKKVDALLINGWRDGLDGIEDYDFWLRMIKIGKRCVNIPEILVKHRLHDKSNFNTKKYDLKKIL